MSSFVDAETGELWEGSDEVEGIRRALNYRQCYISRMPMEDSGAFWDATIYSPRDPKKGGKLALRLKESLDPRLYGGYSSQQFAHFFIYEARDKKGNTVFRFSQVPIQLGLAIEKNKDALMSYAYSSAEAEGLEFVRIQRRKILKKQLVEIDNERFLIRGKKELLNAREIAFSQNDLAVIGDASLGGNDDVGEVSAMLDRIIAEMLGSQVVSRKISSLINAPSVIEKSRHLNNNDKRNLILSLCPVLNGSKDRVDLTAVHGPKRTGTLQVSFNKLLNDRSQDFVIIDQSVTGMFERRTRVGL